MILSVRDEKIHQKSRAEEKRLFSIPLEMISLSKTRVRSNPETDIAGLTESVRRFGVIEPVMVRPDGKNSYELVFGERRLRAAAAAGLKKIPAIITGENSRERVIEIAAAENLQRLPLNMFEEGFICEILEKVYSLTPEQISRRLCLNRSLVGTKKRLFSLTRAERKIIIDSNLSERHARALSRIKDTRMRIFALWQICENDMSASEAEKYVAGIFDFDEDKEKTVGMTKAAIKDIGVFTNTIERAVRLLEENGVEVKCEKNDEKERVEYSIAIAKKIKA